MRTPKRQALSATAGRRRARRRLMLMTAALTLVSAALAATLLAAVVIAAGWYDVGAIVQHWQPLFSMMQTVMRRSVQHNATSIAVPGFTEALVRRGALVYRQQCLQCHGAPGIAPAPIGLAMQPLPGPLVDMVRRWRPAEVYWIVSNGIKMSGMPAWRYRLSDDDMWAVTALIERLPQLSVQDYATLDSSADGAAPVAAIRSGPEWMPPYRPSAVSATRGRTAIPQYACQSCHVIHGVSGGQVSVGPRLNDYAQRRYIAGYLPNTPDNLARWLRSPQQVKPHSAMPDLGVTERDAADIAVYLLNGDQ